MPAAPVHHTAIDSTGAWDGGAAEKAFDKVKGDFVKFYAWVDEGEVDSDADGTDKEDGWGPHHDVSDNGVPGDANLKGVQAAMAALNGAHGTGSTVPDGDRQGVWDHLAAHYKDAGVKADDIPPLRALPKQGESRDGEVTPPVVTPVAPGDVTSDPNAAPSAGELPIYHPIPYRVDPGEAVTCPHCQLKNDTDATFCDQCGTELAGRQDVTVGGVAVGEPYAPQSYCPEQDENVVCPDCAKQNDPDARFCDQCGGVLIGRTDVIVDGPHPDVDATPGFQENAEPVASDPGIASPTAGDYEDVNDGSRHKVPVENLVRWRGSGPAAPAVLLRDDPAPGAGQSGSLMFGYFSTFDEPYLIDDWYEGTFIERVAPGAYDDTIKNDVASMRVLYDHGFDPQLGNKPLGPIQTLRADKIGPYYEVPLLDTDYNRNFLLPALRGQLISGQQVGSLLGSSFRFMVTAEVWDRTGKTSSDNPLGLPVRTITAAKVLEFGPVTFPANEGATSGVRSGTGSFADRLRSDPLSLVRFTDRTSARVVERFIASMPATSRAVTAHRSNRQPVSDDVQTAERRSFSLRARLALADS